MAPLFISLLARHNRKMKNFFMIKTVFKKFLRQRASPDKGRPTCPVGNFAFLRGSAPRVDFITTAKVKRGGDFYFQASERNENNNSISERALESSFVYSRFAH